MKKILFSAIIAVGLLSSCNEDKLSASEVPPPVTTTFSTKYAGATDVEWKKEKKDGKVIYEAAFKFNGQKVEAEFAGDGNFIGEE